MSDQAVIRANRPWEQLERERAAWPERYQAVRDAIALGFWPDAYGPVGRPPTKFAYPAGGIAHPRHASGQAAGAEFWVWSFRDGSPDELRAEACWAAGPVTACGSAGFAAIHTCWSLTLDAAFALVVAAAAHFRRWCICPDPEAWPAIRLLTREWRELVDAFPGAPGQQLGLFDDGVSGPYGALRRAIRAALRPVPDDEPQELAVDYFELLHLVDHVNRIRKEAGRMPPFEPPAAAS